MKFKWPDPFPDAHWLDEREDRAALEGKPADDQFKRPEACLSQTIPAV